MKKSLLVTLAIAAVLAFVVAGWTQTGPMFAKGHAGMKMEKGAGMKMGMCAGMQRGMGVCIFDTEKLGLSDEQKAKVESLRSEMQTQCLETRTKIKELRAELNQLWEADEPDAAKIKEKTRAISELQTNLTEQHTDFALKLKPLLTKEQWAMVKDMCAGGFGCCGLGRGEGAAECPMMGAGKMMRHGQTKSETAPAPAEKEK